MSNQAARLFIVLSAYIRRRRPILITTSSTKNRSYHCCQTRRLFSFDFSQCL